ncbi:hypothetical protein [Brevundimonas sp.]|uniref:hypothetical protein n=1 Tax=Brevundimonas sp. TaxID=1871086 RepID=UPI00391C527A
MRRLSLAFSALLLFSVSACGGGDSDSPETEAEAAAGTDAASETEVPAAGDAAGPAASTEAEVPQDAEARLAGPDAPAFAVIYPGGVINEDEAPSDSGAGGIVTYVTTASPDAVIAFHRTRAEAEGLASVMAMNQGEARAYGAHSTADGGNLSVFATPGEDGGTSVQLVWSAGG